MFVTTTHNLKSDTQTHTHTHNSTLNNSINNNRKKHKMNKIVTKLTKFCNLHKKVSAGLRLNVAQLLQM